MLKLMLALGGLNLLGAMSPGPDFAVVTQQALGHSRKAGIYTACGISCALLMHISYCLLGLAVIITHSPLIFQGLIWLGGAYLVWLGIKIMFWQHKTSRTSPDSNRRSAVAATAHPLRQAFIQGFLTCGLNPKAIVFMLTMFTMVASHPLSWLQRACIAFECCAIVLGWFVFLSWMITHPKIYQQFIRRQTLIMRLLAIFLMLFGVSLWFVKPTQLL